MGNPRLPDELKRLKGTYRADQSMPDTPKVESVQIPAAPRHLTAAERAIWNRWRRILQPLGWIAESDLEALEALCRAQANFDRLCEAEERDQKTWVAASKELRSWMTVLGLTPQARSTVRRLSGERAADDLDQFLSPPSGDLSN